MEENKEKQNIDNINDEITLLKEKLKQFRINKYENENINREDILYRLIYLNKKIKN